MEKGASTKTPIRGCLALPFMTALFMGAVSLIFAFVLKETSIIPFFIVFVVVDFFFKMLFALLPERFKPIARFGSLGIFWLLLFVAAGLLGKTNMQIEGFYFLLLAGVFGGAIVHFLNAKIVGPLFNGRNWCGWSCWTVTILDLLPFKKSPGRVAGPLNAIKYFYAGIALIAVAICLYGFHYTMQTDTPPDSLRAFYWFVIGNSIYYVSGIVVAIILKDNRAFCKYFCPASILLKVSSSFSLVKIQGSNSSCTNCKSCNDVCPMDVDIAAYISNGERVKSNECILCLSCVAQCPQNGLATTIGFDVSTKNHYHYK